MFVCIFILLWGGEVFAADKKISELTEVETLAGTDVLPIVNASATKKVQLTNLVTFGVGSITQGYHANLTAFSGLTLSTGLVGYTGGNLAMITSLQLSDDYAQFKSATASKGTFKMLMTSMNDGILGTFTPVCTGACVLTTESYGAGTYTLVDTATAQTLTNKSVAMVGAGTFAAPITTNPYTLAAAYNSVVYYGATGEIDLPAGVSGMNVIIYNTGAFTITIDPNASQAIVRDGTLQTGGVSITLSSGAGNYVSLHFDGTEWVTLGYKGTLAEGT
jgi:hypothetical protein